MKQQLKIMSIFLYTLCTVSATESFQDANPMQTASNNFSAELPLSLFVATSDQKNAMKDFINGFCLVLSKVNDKNPQNVHILDSFMEENIPTHLLKTIRDLNIGHNTLTKEQIIATLKAKTSNELRYKDKKIPKMTVHRYIELCIAQAFTHKQTQELFSRYVALLIDMQDQQYDNTLLESIIENYKTNGGCWAGVRNRCAISLAYIIAHKIGAL